MKMLLFFIFVFVSISHLGNSSPHPHPNEQSKVEEQKIPLNHANDYLTKLVSPNQMLFFNNYSVDYAHLNGALFIDKENPHQFEKDEEGKLLLKADNLSNHFSVTMPMTLFPSPFPTELYEKARELQQLMAEVHLRVSRDYTFIKENMKKVAEADPTYIGRLVNIMDAVEGNRRQSGLTLILQRSDYLTNVDQPTNGGPTTLSLKQIEVSSGTNAGQGSGYATTVVHQRMLEKIRFMAEPDKLPAWFSKMKVPNNEVLQNQAKALFKTWLRFSEMHADPKAVILLISAPKRRSHSHYEKLNLAQFHLEDYAMEYEKKRKQEGEDTTGKYKPHLVQITIKECAERLVLTKDRHLMLRNEMGEDRRVAIAYFMDGYLPEHFQSEAEWKTRLEMEQSEAVIQPNIFVYFAGTKTIQQALTEPGAMERFFPEAKEETQEGRKLAKNLTALRATFIDQWGLGSGSAEEEAEVKKAIANPGRYVLKCNREGGKGNYFGEDLKKELERMTVEQRGEYILQRKIEPFYAKNVIFPIPLATESQLSFVDVSTELSIYGSLLAETVVPGSSSRADGRKQKHKAMVTDHNQNILLNTVDGYVTRSKITSNHMCNISSGRGGVDSMALFPIKHFHHEQPASCQMDVDTEKLAKEEEAEAA